MCVHRDAEGGNSMPFRVSFWEGDFNQGGGQSSVWHHILLIEALVQSWREGSLFTGKSK